MSVQFNRLPVAVPLALLVASCFLAGCSGSSDNASSAGDLSSEVNVPVDAQSLSDTPALQVSNDSNNSVSDNSASNNVPVSAPTEPPVMNTPPVNPSVPDPLIQNRIAVSFDITVPAYQSNELSVELQWGDVVLTAGWIGDELWSTTAELPTETVHPLIVTFYDRNGDIELARYSEEFRTGSNAMASLQITADQFNSEQFDLDGDGVNNLQELIAGNDPSFDEDSLLVIEEIYRLNGDSRVTVSGDFESRLSQQRPLSVHSEEIITTSSSITLDIDIDTDGNGMLSRDHSFGIESRILSGIRTHSGNAISWEANSFSFDGDFQHSVSFLNTVTVVDENTRTFVEEIDGTNIGTFQFTWQVSSTITAQLVEGTSECEPQFGTISSRFTGNSNGFVVNETTVSKAIGDTYWRVVTQITTTEFETGEPVEIVTRSEKFVRNVKTGAWPDESPYFICDFVDI